MPPPYATNTIRSTVGRRRMPVYDPNEDPYDVRYGSATMLPPEPPVVPVGPPPSPNTATTTPDPRYDDPPTSNPWTDPRQGWSAQGGWTGESLMDRSELTAPRRDETNPEGDRTRLTPPVVPPAGGNYANTGGDYSTMPLPTGESPGNGWDAGKWGNERSVKYVAAAILNRYRNANGYIDLKEAMQDPEWKAWFPNAKAVEGGAHDSIDFGDTLSDFTKGTPVGIVDVGWEFDPVKKTGRGMTWLPRNAAGPARTTAAAPRTLLPPVVPPVVPPPFGGSPGPEEPPRNDLLSTATAEINPEAYRRLVPMRDLMAWRSRTRL
jgi:hypothetical protein